MEARLPLEGIRVVDLTVMLQGPLASAILGDLGAEVIKIEKPGVGDLIRGVKSILHTSNILPDGRNHMWEIGHRNKKAIAINLHDPAGQEAFYRLIANSHAMVTNLQQQALLEMRVDKETIQKINPDLVYVHARGFGARGPHAGDPCQDGTGMARSGFMFNDSAPGGEPFWVTGGLSDVMSATMLAFGAVTGILTKERTGKAPVVYASQLSSMMWLALLSIGTYVNIGAEFPPFDRKNVINPLMNLYKCSDGKWIALGMWAGDRWWHDFCEVAGLQHLETDPRFDTDDKRTERTRELTAIIDEVFATRPREEWERVLREKELLCSVINRYSELPDDPQVQANDYIVSFDNGVKAVALPFELEGMQLRRQGAPQHGEHTDQVLQDVCGYSWDEILDLKEKGTIW